MATKVVTSTDCGGRDCRDSRDRGILAVIVVENVYARHGNGIQHRIVGKRL